jgi:hypothetical protein
VSSTSTDRDGVVDTVRTESRKVAEAIGSNDTASFLARLGFAARAGFYLVLAGLIAVVAVQNNSGGDKTSTNGALHALAQNWLGEVAIAAAAAGFLVLGIVRLAGAVRDHEADWQNRTLTALQGAFYVGLTWIPTSFLLGNHSTGSDKAQRTETATLLGLPGGQFWVIALGLIVLGVSSYQIVTAVKQDFTEGMALDGAPRWACRLVESTGTIGIAARAAVFIPVAVFLLVAGWQAQPQEAKGLDAEFAKVAGQPWGPPVLGLVALGLLIFAVYSVLEAVYRRVSHSA